MKALIVILGLTASLGSLAGNPDYQDPHYLSQLQAYTDCAGPKATLIQAYYGTMVTLYPRFGIAYREMERAIANVHPDSPSVVDSLKQIHQQFIDRILSTAEPEALQEYNRMTDEYAKAIKACGQLPQPPVKP